jgi:hypothetical protein
VADLRGFKLWGMPAWLAWVVVHIAFLIGFRNRLIVMIQWAWAYVTHQRGARIITCDREFAPWPRGSRPVPARGTVGRDGREGGGERSADGRSREGGADESLTVAAAQEAAVPRR